MKTERMSTYTALVITRAQTMTHKHDGRPDPDGTTYCIVADTRGYVYAPPLGAFGGPCQRCGGRLPSDA